MRQTFPNRWVYVPAWPDLARSKVRSWVVRAAQVRAAHSPLPSVIQIGYEAWVAFVAHAIPVLVLAVTGAALPVALGLIVARGQALDRARHGVIFAEYLPVPLAWAIQLIAAIIGLAFARGAITHLVIGRAGWRAAMRAACRGWAMLIAGSALHISLMIAGAIALDVLLVQINLNTTSVGLRAVTKEGMSKITLKRGLDALLMDPSLPIEGIDEVRMDMPFAHHYERPLEDGHFEPFQVMWQPGDRGYGLVVFGGLACLIVAHVLLRLRAAAFMRDTFQSGLSLWSGLRLCIKHFGYVALHGAIIRIGLCLLLMVAVIAPVEIARDFALTQVFRFTGLEADGVRLIAEGAVMLSAALIGAAAWAFEAVYDARLFAALTTMPVKAAKDASN